MDENFLYKWMNKIFNNGRYKEGDLVFYQKEVKKSWHGPTKVNSHRGRSVFVIANGNIRKVADCMVQPHGSKDENTELGEKVLDENTDTEEVVHRKEFAEDERELGDELTKKTRSESRIYAIKICKKI